MQSENYYTTLNFDVKKRPHPGMSQGMMEAAQRCPRWHRIALGIGGAGHLLLLGAVIALSLRGFWYHPTGCNGEGPSINTSDLHSSQCLQNQGTHRESKNITAAVSAFTGCAGDWLHHGGKCYFFSMTLKSWSDSRDDCAKRDAQLLEIQDASELVFIHNSRKAKNRAWIGLRITAPGHQWKWVTGLAVDTVRII
ncbi:killer cell lectin-like receptor subfamily F member 1 isoform X2 [Microcaecilia unicolor]|uniref:Killer cell lectin-like receptor subfamily F member 1 isoform X2 n=1 Tax=Microcaecilia unicolor TaxID=1415580 RepID=A0A6P7WY90_9AMPH|nr:killer cell lectin-like receptor subfamily F member 1 isoform X2 [Microcaecilia unicolor]